MKILWITLFWYNSLPIPMTFLKINPPTTIFQILQFSHANHMGRGGRVSLRQVSWGAGLVGSPLESMRGFDVFEKGKRHTHILPKEKPCGGGQRAGHNDKPEVHWGDNLETCPRFKNQHSLSISLQKCICRFWDKQMPNKTSGCRDWVWAGGATPGDESLLMFVSPR